jgi:hypothetical protein
MLVTPSSSVKEELRSDVVLGGRRTKSDLPWKADKRSLQQIVSGGAVYVF